MLCSNILYFTSLPNGKTEANASLKCWTPHGIPTMVQQNIKPKTRWVSAISHQPNSIHSTLNTICRQPASFSVGTKSWPKGHNANTPILNSCTPKGIPIIVMHITTPANQYIIAVNRPPSINQTRLPKNFMIIRCFVNFSCKDTDFFGNKQK